MMTRYKECPVVAPAEYPSRADLLHRHIRLESPVAELVRNALSFAKILTCQAKVRGDVKVDV